jgi:hypothetical protein
MLCRLTLNIPCRNLNQVIVFQKQIYVSITTIICMSPQIRSSACRREVKNHGQSSNLFLNILSSFLFHFSTDVE